MNHENSPYLSWINEITWQEIEQFPFPSAQLKAWLLESGSLSKCLQRHCEKFSVDLLVNQWLNAGKLTPFETHLLDHPQKYLQRQVILRGDEHPWVFGCSLIPEITTQDEFRNLSEIGDSPLGETVFGAQSVARDALQVASIDTELGLLYARRSRLWMNHKPMLVTELFLPLAPIYTLEN